MIQLARTAKKVAIIASTLLLINAPTAAVFAADDCPAPASGNGVHTPTGSDASTFTYQCDGQYAGMYTNQYYVYNPSDQSRTPLYSPDYQYSCSTNKWTMIYWSYSPASNNFYSSRVAANTTPNQATNCPVATSPAGGSGSGSTAATGGNGGGSGTAGQSISNTGNGSTNGINNNGTSNKNNTNNNNLTMNNGLTSLSNTGNAQVSGNTTGGSATTGDAQTVANIANLLQSNSNAFGPGLDSFVANINGDVNGDFMFDPSAIIGDTGPNSSNGVNNNFQVNTNNANNTNAQINNNINVGATSGDASVSGNTNGGNATSGNAQAVVNLMNLINSTISSGKSFVGTININGNLNGDILLPDGFVNQLLANTGPSSTNTANNNTSSNSNTTNNNNLNTKNTVNSTAQSGSADSSGNTSAGDATSGSAKTNVTMLNLTGSNVVDKNDLLVFVNVLGHWVGMIMNAPAGSTAAELGGGVTSTGPNSNNSTNTNLSSNDNTVNNNNLGINNNVNVSAKTGNASVTDNTKGGNAKSGDASTAVNILNVNGTNLNVSDWLGVLFINVFGNWTGSFGVNTSAGDAPQTASTANNSSQVVQFTPSSTPSSNDTSSLASKFTTIASALSGNLNNATVSGSTSGTSQDGVVLAAKTTKVTTPTVDPITPAQKTVNHLILPAAGVIFAALILFAGERKFNSKKS